MMRQIRILSLLEYLIKSINVQRNKQWLKV
jgi:hypothetical protein